MIVFVCHKGDVEALSDNFDFALVFPVYLTPPVNGAIFVWSSVFHVIIALLILKEGIAFASRDKDGWLIQFN